MQDYTPEPHCFVCGRHTDHFAEHDDLVDAGLAEHDDRTGSVYRVQAGTDEEYRAAVRVAIAAAEGGRS